MLSCQKPKNCWVQFLELVQQRCSRVEYENWFAPIQCVSQSEDEIVLEVPNIFVREYLLDNYKKDLLALLPSNQDGEPAISFVVAEVDESKAMRSIPKIKKPLEKPQNSLNLNGSYTFENFIDGPTNQFIKSAALGVATHPGKSYNPLFIHGGVGLGKTHLLHSISHHIKSQNKKLRIQCITTEAFINELVNNLKSKSVDKMKRFYRNLDVLLVDDIQFLQNRLNFEEEFCNMFETLINQNKQIVIASDKPPGQLKLSERMIARMEWGLVAHVAMPDLETRVAILQHKAEQKGFMLTNKVAFFIAERICSNVRQLEGALNRVGAYCRMMCLDATQEVVEKTLSEMLQAAPQAKVTVDNILKSVAAMYEVKVSDLTGTARNRKVAFPRQIAMYLAKELISDSLMKLASSFGGKTHSTLLHAWKKISKLLEKDETLRRQIRMTRQNIEA